MFAAAPHLRVAQLGDDLVVFDLSNDRYLALPGALTPRTHDSSRDEGPLCRLDPAAAEALVCAGLVTPGPASPPTAIAPPTRIMVSPEGRAGLGDALRLLTALSRLGFRLARGRHVRSFVDEHFAWCPEHDGQALREALGRLRRLSLIVPLPRRCLPRALATALFLRGSDLIVDIVFGVKAHPFDAHCWLEWNGMVLDDDLDRVRRYTPIAIGRA